MSNVIPIYGEQPISKEEVKDTYEENMDAALMVGWDSDGDFTVTCTPMKRSEALYLTEKLRDHIMRSE